jgi:hypothetical protein
MDRCDAASINDRSDEVAPELNVQPTAGVADAEQRLAAGLFNTSFQIGGAILVAVVSAMISGDTTAVGREAKPPPAACERTSANVSLVSVDRSARLGGSNVTATHFPLGRKQVRRA